MKQIICLYGQPASGKTTQAELLAKKFNFSIFGMGETLRAEVASGSELGQAIKPFLDNGTLISDDLMAKIITRAGEKAGDAGLIFDGFPRMISQANMLDKVVADNNWEIIALIHLNISPETALARIKNRAQNSTAFRSDDNNDEAIKNRFAVFQKESVPLLDFYRSRNLLQEINGELNIEEVESLIIKSLAL